MILDALLQLSGAPNNMSGGQLVGQPVTAVGSTLSNNVVDLAATPKAQTADIGMGEGLEIYVAVLQSLTSAGAATVQFQLVQADDAGISSNVQVITQTDAIPFATLVAGTRVPLRYSRATQYPARRYIAVRYVVAGAALTNTTGQFFTSMVKDVADPVTIYKGGFTVL